MLVDEQPSLRKRLEYFWLRCVRYYTFRTPIATGKYRLLLAAMMPCRTLPFEIESATSDGRRFRYTLDRGLNETIFFLGEYEKAVSDIMRKLVRADDLCLDVGANSGWYATLLAAAGAEVHAFEPMPHTFSDLERNIALNDMQARVRVNNVGLGDEAGELTFNSFKGLSTGYASMSDLGRDDAVPVVCQVDTISSYVDANLNGREVDLIKVDIEGAELAFLKGADRIFEQNVLPILQIEMALELTRNFGYFPDDLIRYIADKADYEFYAVDEVHGTLYRVEGFRHEQIGANVFCIPARGREDRLAAIRSLITN